MEEYPKEELQKIYEALPDDLKKALFSQQTANIVDEIGRKNNVPEEKIIEIIKYCGYVLLGLLPPADLRKTLKEKLSLPDETAESVSQEIIQLVFLPLKISLEALYGIEITLGVKPAEEIMPKQEIEEEKPREKPFTKGKLKNKDTYRESIE